MRVELLKRVSFASPAAVPSAHHYTATTATQGEGYAIIRVKLAGRAGALRYVLRTRHNNVFSWS